MKTHKTFKCLIVALSIIEVMFCCSKRQDSECTIQQNQNYVSKLQYLLSSGQNYLYPFSIEYDTSSNDFFYFGTTTSRNNNFFISRKYENGTEIWTRKFYKIPIPRSFMYSEIEKAIYASIFNCTTFTLLKLNSTDGSNVQVLQGGTVYQNSYYHSCSLSNDELNIFCSGQASYSDDSLAIVKFNISNSNINTIKYSNNMKIYNSDLVLLPNNEIFFHAYQSNRFHYIKGTFGGNSTNHFEEHFHKLMSGGHQFDYLRSAVDENTQTMVNVRSYDQNKLIYSQHNLSDFSLVGSMHIAYLNNYFQVYYCYLEDEKVYFSLKNGDHYEIYEINATTQNMIMAYQADSGNVFSSKPLLFRNRHMNIISQLNNGTSYFINHIKVPSNLDSKIPNYNQINNRNLSITTDSVYGYTNEAITNHSFVNQSLSFLNGRNSTSVSTIEIDKNNSFILPINDPNYTQFYVLSVGQVKTYTISIPCEPYNFNNSIVFNEVQQLPDWVTINNSNNSILFEAPDVGVYTRSFNFSINSTIVDYEYIFHYKVLVVICNRYCNICEDGKCKDEGWPPSCSNYITLKVEVITSDNIITNNSTIDSDNENTNNITRDNDSTNDGYSYSDFNLGVIGDTDYTSDICYENISNGNDDDDTSSDLGLDSDDSNTFSFSFVLFENVPTLITLNISFGMITLIDLITRMINRTSERDEWLIFHMLQQLVMLPLMAKFMADHVKQFIVFNVYYSLSIYSIRLDWLESTSFIQDLSFDQFNDYFIMLGWDSGSTLVNNIFLIVLLLIIVLLHLLVWLLCRLTKNCDNCLHRTLYKLFDFLTFSAYIRIFYEIYFFILLMVVYEINFYNKAVRGDHISEQSWSAEKGNKISVVYAYIICILLILFHVLSIASWYCNLRTINIDKNCLTRELYLGLRKFNQNKNRNSNIPKDAPLSMKMNSLQSKVRIARLYPSLFLYRRTCMVFILVFIEDFDAKIYSLIIMQVVRVNYSFWIRSFNMKKDQILEIFNEAVYLVLMVLLTLYTTSDKWTVKSTFVYIGIIFSYLLIYIVIAMSTLIKLICGGVKKLLRKLRIIRTKDSGSKESEVDGGLKGRSMKIFSDISVNIQNKQDSFRVEKMYSFDLSDNQSFCRRSTYSL